MGAEPDFSPPQPELTHSSEPEISGKDSWNWKADMMSALGESVSFGRFLMEPLKWGKWSAFTHNRYLEKVVVQARSGSVAQKKAFFKAHYARKKRKSEDHAATSDDVAGGDLEAVEDGGAASWSLSAMESSCMTDEPLTPAEEVWCGWKDGVVDCGDSANDKEIPILNQDITDSIKKRRIQPASLLSKPTKHSSPPIAKKGQSSSAKRQSMRQSAKENTSPPSADSCKLGTTSTPQKTSTLSALHMSMSFT
ncbi:unnamed protein product [Miscanthus lutarioriparius]|uniref:Uncharacterized protein n=1 Tax=Miscanthus lutarioriparius TaxID=422564 RepID=A0A811RJY1_9POAL|nr:unnamed protein product [Miscanthus lutarioriparius]